MNNETTMTTEVMLQIDVALREAGLVGLITARKVWAMAQIGRTALAAQVAQVNASAAAQAQKDVVVKAARIAWQFAQ